jgi:hypothetical protein
MPSGRPTAHVENPFRIGGLVSGAHFTNRAEERRRIRRALTTPQAHLIVFGARRMGKTSTLEVVREELAAKGRLVVMADLSTASTLADVTNRVLHATARALGRGWHDALAGFLQRLTLKVAVSPDPGTGLLVPSLDVSVRDSDLDTQRSGLGEALDGLEQLAASRRSHIGVVLDEFQEIHRFGGERAEAHLRAIIQRQKHVTYVLAGSDEHLIRAMMGARRPLYKLLEPLEFGPIDADHLAAWVESRMKTAGVEAKGIGNAVVALAGPRTRDVVQLARATFEAGRGSGRATDATVAEGFRQIVLAEDTPIRSLWESLSPLQQNVLRAVATRAAGLTTRETRRRHALNETGTATKAALTLVSRDILVKAGAAYRYESPFMRGWVIANALADAGLSLPVTHLP